MPSEKKGLLDLKSTAEHELLPVRLVAHETISELFHFQIEAVATASMSNRNSSLIVSCATIRTGASSCSALLLRSSNAFFSLGIGCRATFGMLPQKPIHDRFSRR